MRVKVPTHRQALGVRWWWAGSRSLYIVPPADEGTQAFSGPPSTAPTSTSRAKRERKLLTAY